MTTAATVVPAGDWSFEDYRKRIAQDLEAAFKDDKGNPIDPDLNIPEALADLPEHIRLDFDPRWEVKKEVPGRDELVILCIFESQIEATPADFRVYTFPKAPLGDKPFLRYTLSRIGAASTVEAMSRKTFLSEIVEEYATLLEGKDEPEPEARAAPATA